jgi:hypothetical protein
LLTKTTSQTSLLSEKARAKDAASAARDASIWARTIYAKYTTIVHGLVTRNFPLTNSIKKYGRQQSAVISSLNKVCQSKDCQSFYT